MKECPYFIRHAIFLIVGVLTYRNNQQEITTGDHVLVVTQQNMFNVKIKVKEGDNSFPPSKNSTSFYLNGGSNSSYSSSLPRTRNGSSIYSSNNINFSPTSSLRSSLVSSNRSPYNSIRQKKKVRILTEYVPPEEKSGNYGDLI